MSTRYIALQEQFIWAAQDTEFLKNSKNQRRLRRDRF
ncbi:unnamed protein product [Oikopleura dioica]|uniref:Uncharacterized protein n=1 Tax=Oikopleura dioica TaxID=34765 RepID=E4YBP6_OIKDI|nr:unnamed protein product [Oikopleura dioica]